MISAHAARTVDSPVTRVFNKLRLNRRQTDKVRLLIVFAATMALLPLHSINLVIDRDDRRTCMLMCVTDYQMIM